MDAKNDYEPRPDFLDLEADFCLLDHTIDDGMMQQAVAGLASFTLDNLMSYLNYVIDPEMDNNNQLVCEETRNRGRLTGMLLSELTRRNRQKGKETEVYFNLNGRTFHYLFYGADCIDTVLVRNGKGDCILGNVATNGGDAKKVYAVNLQGRHILAEIGTGGTVEEVVAYEVKGHQVLYRAASEGAQVGALIAIDIGGEYPLQDVAEVNILGGSQGRRSTIGLFVGNSIHGKEPFKRFDEQDCIDQKILHNPGEIVSIGPLRSHQVNGILNLSDYFHGVVINCVSRLSEVTEEMIAIYRDPSNQKYTKHELGLRGLVTPYLPF